MRLAMSMNSQVLAPGEIAPLRQLYVITRGLVLYGGAVLSHGMAWGDDVLLTDQRYFLPFIARAMSYVDVYTLSRETLVRVTSTFPGSAEIIRRSTVRLALRRHIISVYKAHKEAKEREKATRMRSREGPREGEGGGVGDFLDRVHSAAETLSHAQMQMASVNLANQLKESQRAERGKGRTGGMSGGGGATLSGGGGDGDEEPVDLDMLQEGT